MTKSTWPSLKKHAVELCVLAWKDVQVLLQSVKQTNKQKQGI